MSQRRIELTPAADIMAEPVTWAWEDRVPVGGVTLVVGDPGHGKSTLTVELLARASRGQLAGDWYGIPVPVALVTAEDAIAQVVRPRLEAADADLAHALIVQATDEHLPTGLALPADIPALETQLREVGARWLVVDPVVAHLPIALDANKDQHVRRALAPLAKLAEELNLAVVGVVHLNKSADTRAVGRVCGSIGLVGAARSVLLLGPDPHDPESDFRVLVQWKTNYGRQAPPLRFRIAGRVLQTPTAEVQTSAMAWCGEATGVTASDLVTAPEDDDEQSALEEAMEIIGEIVKHGPVAVADARKTLRDAGIADRTANRARARLGVRAKPDGVGGPWEWHPPSLAKPGTHPTNGQTDKTGKNGANGAGKPPVVSQSGQNPQSGHDSECHQDGQSDEPGENGSGGCNGLGTPSERRSSKGPPFSPSRQGREGNGAIVTATAAARGRGRATAATAQPTLVNGHDPRPTRIDLQDVLAIFPRSRRCVP